MKLWLTMAIWGLSLAAFGQSVFNVTNYGAIGNCTNVTANIVSNSATIICNQPMIISNSFCLNNAGPWGIGNLNHQGLVAYIIATNPYTGGQQWTGTLDRVCGNTTNGAFGQMGTNNWWPYQAAVNAAGTNGTVYSPTGNYLMFNPTNYTSYVMSSYADYHWAVSITNGGLTFSGDGTNLTTITGCGVWVIHGQFGLRGSLFGQIGPGVNFSTTTFHDMCWNGAAIQGFTGLKGGPPMNVTNGNWWDSTHHAWIEGLGQTPTNTVMYNMLITGWEGEDILTTSTLTNCTGLFSNCVFGNGDASGFNFQFPHLVEDCSFYNLTIAMEYDDFGYLFPSVWTNNFMTNVIGCWERSGSTLGTAEPSFTIVSNTAYFTGSGVQTAPAQNVNIIGNYFNGPNGINFSTEGGIGNGPNANIIVAWNTFTNNIPAVEFSQSQGICSNILVAWNTVYLIPNVNNYAFQNFAVGTNIYFHSNTVFGTPQQYLMNQLSASGQWFFDAPDNAFPWMENVINPGVTNPVTYAYGYHEAVNPASSGSVFALDNSSPNQVPPNSQVLFTNQSSTQSVTLYPNDSNYSNPLTIAANGSQLFYWLGSSWSTNQNPNVYFLIYNR